MTRTGWLVAAIIVLGTARFLPGCAGTEMILDDTPIVEQHPVVRENDVAGAFTSPWWWTPPGQIPPPNWRPLTLAGFALQHAVTGAPPPAPVSPVTWRGVNLLSYAAVILLMWWLARRLCGADPPALLATALFAFHPAHVEAVVPIVGRADLWAAAGVIGACLAWLRYRESGQAGWQFAAVGALAAGLLAKESAAPAVLLLPLLDAWVVAPERRPARTAALVSYLPVAGAVVVWLLLRWLVLGGATFHQPGDGGGVGATLLGFGRNLGWTVLLFVWPWWTHHILSTLPKEAPWHYPPMEWSLGGVLLLGFAVAVSLGWWALRRRAPVAAFCWAAAIACWLPTSGLVPIGAGVALRFLFLPSVFACCGVALGIQAVAARVGGEQRERVVAAVGAVVAVIGIALGGAHAAKWQDRLTFHESLLAQVPDCYGSLVAAGGAHHARGDTATAIDYLERARAKAPHRLGVYHNLLIVYSWGDGAVQYGPSADLQRSGEVIAAWRDAAPNLWIPYYEQGLWQRRLGKHAEARASFAAALERKPPEGMRARLEALLDGRDG